MTDNLAMEKVIIKGCLREHLLQRRPDITADFEPKPTYPLTEEEKFKERRRKESNRRSAAKSRQKQKEQDEEYRKILSQERQRKIDLSKKIETLSKLKTMSIEHLMGLGISKPQIHHTLRNSSGMIYSTLPVENDSHTRPSITRPLFMSDNEKCSATYNVSSEHNSETMPTNLNKPNVVVGPSFTKEQVNTCVDRLDDVRNQGYIGKTTPANSDLSQSEKDILMELVALENNIEMSSSSCGPCSNVGTQGFEGDDSGETSIMPISPSVPNGDNQMFSFPGDSGPSEINTMSHSPCFPGGDNEHFSFSGDGESSEINSVSLSPCAPGVHDQGISFPGSEESAGFNTMSMSSCTNYSMSPLNHQSGFYNQTFSMNQALAVCM